MKAEIIPVGTEILLGNIIDTNSSFLANQLPLLGIDLYFISTVGDNQKRLVDTLKRARMILPEKLLANWWGRS
jgi:nicotinamide-nucleotide amidase